jgi:hypothetical protein
MIRVFKHYIPYAVPLLGLFDSSCGSARERSQEGAR